MCGLFLFDSVTFLPVYCYFYMSLFVFVVCYCVLVVVVVLTPVRFDVV